MSEPSTFVSNDFTETITINKRTNNATVDTKNYRWYPNNSTYTWTTSNISNSDPRTGADPFFRLYSNNTTIYKTNKRIFDNVEYGFVTENDDTNGLLSKLVVNGNEYKNQTLIMAVGMYSNLLGTFNVNAIVNVNGIWGMVCFKEGTKILTDKGYKPIQDLRKGDLVKTLNNDYKQIDMIGKRDIYHPSLEDRIKDQLYKCSETEYPEVFEDLVITGCHSILVDSFSSEEQKEKVIEVNGDTYVTDNKYRVPACCDYRASVYEVQGTYTIYHFALENDNYYMNYGIYANGLLVETCSKRYLKELSNMTLIE
jgi:hypothetical protein